MIIGNHKVHTMMREYVDGILQSGKIAAPFLVFHGPEYIGKSTFAQSLAAQLVGDFTLSDILVVKDLSQQIGKKHTLKIEAGDNITLDSGFVYEDVGAREIRERMSKSAAGSYKVLVLENIERMTPSAANAFLKYFEEPFPHTLIIATTKNKSELLDTIISRALLISFDYVSDEEVKELLQQEYPETSEARIQALVDLAAGRPGFILTLMAKDKELIQDLQDNILRFISLHQQGARLQEIFRLLSDMQKKGYLDIFLDTLLYHYEREHNYDMITQLIETRRRLSYNISAENVLFSFALHDAA